MYMTAALKMANNEVHFVNYIPVLKMKRCTTFNYDSV